MSTGLIAEKQIEELEKLDLTIRECQQAVIAAEQSANPTMMALTTAKAMVAIRKALTNELLQDVMELQGSPLGFTGDKRYPIDVVRDVFIEAAIRGFRMSGNEVCIIAGRFYGGKAGWQRKVRELEGLTDLVIDFGVPQMSNGGALVPAKATWLLNGRPMSVDRLESPSFDHRIPVRLNAGMGIDGALGKAERKLLAMIYERCTGTTVTVDDEPPANELAVTSQPGEQWPEEGIARFDQYEAKVADCVKPGDLSDLHQRFCDYVAKQGWPASMQGHATAVFEKRERQIRGER